MERVLLCRDCRNGRKVFYPFDDPELCPVLPWHSQCPDCGQEMEEIAESFDSMHANRILHQYGISAAELAAAVGMGKLRHHPDPKFPDEEPHYFEDEVIAAFGAPRKAWPPRNPGAM